MKSKPVEILILATITVLLTIFFEPLLAPPVRAGVTRFWYWFEGPQKTLEDAARDRSLMTDTSLRSAIAKYRSLIKRTDINKSLKVQAYQGASRTYSTLCLIRFWRGLSCETYGYGKEAEDLALQAEGAMSGQVETGIALAYSYAVQEIGRERAASTKKVGELLVSHPDNSDVQFLAWKLGITPAARSFEDRLDDPERFSDLILLGEVGLSFAMGGNQTSDAAERERLFKRSDEFLSRAARVAPENAIILFRRGYLAQVRNHLNEAREYYEEALRKEKDFPRARDNLGTIYQAFGEYQKASHEFEEAALAEGVQRDARTYALHNWGESYFELDRAQEACDKWNEAHALGSAEGSWMVVHGAICMLLGGKPDSARDQYKKAVELGEKEGLNLKKIDEIRNKWKIGPRETKTIEKLIELLNSAGGDARR